MHSTGRCPLCGGDLIRRNRALLLLTGLALLVAAGVAVYLSRILLIVAVPAALIGIYLVLWGTIGKGLWCRACKTFPVPRQPTGPL